MENQEHMESFISAVVEYTKNPSEETASILQRDLGVIGATRDLDIFDPECSIAAKFYVSLYELMILNGPTTPLMGNALTVLQNACRDNFARRALLDTYKFAPILMKLLEINLTPEKVVRVLEVLHKLTVGKKVSSQGVPSLALISALTQWVMESHDQKIVWLSLETLGNLCYKNLSAVHTLMRTVDEKTLIRTLIRICSNNVNIRVHCCKLILIMASTNNSIPGGHILDIVAMTFSSLIPALKYYKFLLKPIVDTFVDATQVPHLKAVIVNYENYAADVGNILSTIKRDLDDECVALVMKFLLSLASLKLPSLNPLYPLCVKVAMSWVPPRWPEAASPKALALIRTIVIVSREIQSFPQVLAELDFSVLMDVSKYRWSCHHIYGGQIFTELMQLVQEMARIPHLKNKVTQAFSEQSMRELFKPILEENDLSGASEWPEIYQALENSFNHPDISLFMQAIALTADLAPLDSAWLTLYSEILQKKRIRMIMALALRTDGFEVKQKVFN